MRFCEWPNDIHRRRCACPRLDHYARFNQPEAPQGIRICGTRNHSKFSWALNQISRDHSYKMQ